MKKNWLIILITSVLLLTLLLPIALVKPELSGTDLFSVKVTTKVNSEEIGCWKSDKGDFFVFLPDFANVSTAVFKLRTESDLFINGKKIKDGQSLSNFELNKKYDLSFSRFGKKQTASLTFMQSENIATMFIDTASGDMEYIHTNKGKGEEGKLRTYFADGTLNCKVDITSLAGRGNNTWDTLMKKPYSLDLSQPTDILDMGSADRWVLLANAADPSNLRNKIAYDFANEMGLSYSPDSRWVDLYLNGEYAGIYLLCERIEIGKDRIDISNKNSLLLSMEDETQLKDKQRSYITTENGKAYRIHFPKTVSKAETELILNKCQKLENSVLGGKDLSLIIDLESFAKKYLIDEMLGNLDGYILSNYLYCETLDGKFYAGPVWDYDKAMGNDSDKWYSVTNANTFVVGRNPSNPLDNGYISAFMKNADFMNKVTELFESEFSNGLNDFLNEKIPQYIAETEAAFEMNKVRWFSDAGVGSLKQEADEISKYLTEHNKFLQSAWVEGKEYCKVSITKLSNDIFFAVLKGETLTELPEIENTEWGVFDGLYYRDSNEPFDITKPITEDTELYAKWVDSKSNKTDNLLKLIPVILFAVLFAVVFVVNIKHIKRAGDEI